MTGHRQIGIDRLIRLEWLRETALLSANGVSPLEIKGRLQKRLSGSFRTDRTDVRGSIDKTITILLKTWVAPREELQELCRSGLQLLENISPNDDIAIHWAMISAAYPFWFDVATQTGRLLKLQTTVAASEVQRRICEQYGERETVSRRVRYVLRSFNNWNVIEDTETKGLYARGSAINVHEPYTAAWILEATLLSQGFSAIPFSGVFETPGLFPIVFQRFSAQEIAAASSQLDSLPHGLDQDLLVLR